MCGIAALWDQRLTRPARERTVRWMGNVLAHRGPDDDGVWSSDAAPLAIAHRRLAIQGLGAQGHQPMVTPRGNGVLAFNGELFDFADLRDDLCRASVVFHGRSDTEVLLHALDRFGVKTTLARIRGQFAFAWFSNREKRFVVARDRVGIRPLYFALDEAAGRIAIASEQKALLGLQWVSRSIHIPAALRYLSLGRTDDVPFETMVRGIRSLPPGHYAEWDGRTLRVERYFRVDDAPPPSTTAEVAAALRDAVGGQLIGEVPIGTTVSGGIDSSAVALLADQHRIDRGSREPLHLFAYHDQLAEQDEREYQQAVLDAVKSPHVVHWVSSSPATFASDFERYIHHQEEPYGDASSYAEYCIAREASRAGVKVLLSGLGGDEVFVGYPTFLGPLTIDMTRAGDLSGLLQLAAATPKILARGRAAMHVPFSGAAYHALPSAVRNAATAFRSSGSRGLVGALRLDAMRDAVRSWHQHDGTHATNASLRGAIESWCIPRYLLHSDRMGLAHGVEGRYPLIDEHVIRKAFGIPVRARVGASGLKAALREAASDVLPPIVRDRAWKLGFHAPLGAYVRGVEPALREGLATVRQSLGTHATWEALDAGSRWAYGMLGTYVKWVARQPLSDR